jgi:pyruvate ferredoxin oxidoreductase gamma subunit
VTAAELLCDIAYQDGFRDVLSVPIIGAERRGSPVRANAKLSEEKEIKNYSDCKNPDVTLVFDPTLLDSPGVLEGIQHGIVIINTRENYDPSRIPEGIDVYTVDATGISIDLKLLVAGSPVLNVPMIGAYAKVTGHLKLSTIKKVLEDTFSSKAELNYEAAEKAYENVIQIR